MARAALIIGGTGQIGRAVARNLLWHGWRICLAQRSSESLPLDLAKHVQAIPLDRDQPGALAAAVSELFDVIIDTIAFTEDHARQLIETEQSTGALVVISSASVYRDAHGRTLDEASENGFPRFPGAISEDQPTVEPGPKSYSTRKV